MEADLNDALRDPRLDAAAARAILERAPALPRDVWLAIVRDEGVAPVVRRLVIRRLLEAEAHPGATVGELGSLVAAGAWLAPAHARQVSIVKGKLPVRWLAEDLIVAIDVCPAVPASDDRHRLLLYLRIGGQPELEEVVSGLCGGPGGGHEVRELGFEETESPRPGATEAPGPRTPSLNGLQLCRRALCDGPTGMHTLVDVIVELPVRLPGPAGFDIYLQLRGLTGPATLAIDVIQPRPAGEVADDGGDGGEEVVLTSGTLQLGASAEAPEGPPPPALGVAIPNVTVGFERAGEHWVRIRCGGAVLGEHRFQVVDMGGG